MADLKENSIWLGVEFLTIFKVIVAWDGVGELGRANFGILPRIMKS